VLNAQPKAETKQSLKFLFHVLNKELTMSNSVYLENKSTDVHDVLEEMHRTFAVLREDNDARLAQMETRRGVDVITEEKVARIDQALDETKRRLDRLALDQARPKLGLGEKAQAFDHATQEHKAAFRGYMRSGDAVGLKQLEEKTLSQGSGPDGGFLVPVPVEQEIIKRLAAISPIRSISSTREISGASYRAAFSFQGPAAGWVAESDPRPQTANQQIADMTYHAMEMYAMPAATQTLLDDAAVDIEQWIAQEIDVVFAEQEGAAFVNGDGNGKPKGFLSYTKVAQSSWTPGNTGYVVTGTAGAFPASNPSDLLFDFIYSIAALSIFVHNNPYSSA
jgi:HK97 family phage major capsid protein